MISVIIPVYNAEEYLDQCVRSVCRQTYTELEIILVNDGSTDRSYDICEKFRKQDQRIRVIHNENKGLVSARIDGINASRGEYIAFVDADDWIEPAMYEEMYKTMQQEQVDIVMSGRFEDTGDVSRAVYHGIPKGRYDRQSLVRDVFPKMIVNENFFEWGIFPGLWDKLFRRENLYKYQNKVDRAIRMGEDAACVYPCILNAKSIYIMGKCFYHYRQSTGTMVKQKDAIEVERHRFLVLYETVKQQLETYRDIYDLRSQWTDYVLFLMIPRADGLYRGFESLEYLFPFPQIKKGADIVLYGAGTYGQRLYRYLKESGFCNVIRWVDRNYRQLQEFGLPVENPNVIEQTTFAYIVVAVSFAKPRKELYRELSMKYGNNKVAILDEELVKSRESLMAFGLNKIKF
ncbi:MAG: glycosyltransferase family 2 protein [Lachnospiraceae bacterium]|nr:glycosyltransferase family 2 protein [Lachnospiraceae bacterium]